MNDELKTWVRILKFGMPSVVAYSIILAGFILVWNDDLIISMKGMMFIFAGLWFFSMFQNIRMSRKLKEIKECQKS